MAIFVISSDFLKLIQASQAAYTKLQDKISTLQVNPQAFPKYQWHQRVLKRNGKVVVRKDH